MYDSMSDFWDSRWFWKMILKEDFEMRWKLNDRVRTFDTIDFCWILRFGVKQVFVYLYIIL